MATHGLVLLAVIEEDVDELIRLIREGADIDETDEEMGNTPSHEAAIGGSMPCLEILLAAGANTCAINRQGNTALHEAADAGFDTCVRALLLSSTPAPIDATNYHGNTSLHLAAAGKYPVCMEYLLWAGADMHVPNKDGHTVIDFANSMAGNVRTALLEVLRVEELRRKSMETTGRNSGRGGRAGAREPSSQETKAPLSHQESERALVPIGETPGDVEEGRARAAARAAAGQKKLKKENAQLAAQQKKAWDAKQQIEEHLRKEREEYRAHMRKKMELRKRHERDKQLKERLESQSAGGGGAEAGSTSNTTPRSAEEGAGGQTKSQRFPSAGGAPKSQYQQQLIAAGIAWEDTAFENAKARRQHMERVAAESRAAARKRKESEDAERSHHASGKLTPAAPKVNNKKVEAKVVQTANIYGQTRVGPPQAQAGVVKTPNAHLTRHLETGPVRLPAVGMSTVTTSSSMSTQYHSELLNQIHLTMHYGHDNRNHHPNSYSHLPDPPDRSTFYTDSRHGAKFYSHVYPDLY